MKAGERVRELRRLRGLSQEGLVDVSGVSLGAISNLERGENVRVETIQRIARALGVTVSELLGETPATVEEELPGWGVLPGDHRRVLRELVASYAAVTSQGQDAAAALRRVAEPQPPPYDPERLSREVREALSQFDLPPDRIEAAVSAVRQLPALDQWMARAARDQGAARRRSSGA